VADEFIFKDGGIPREKLEKAGELIANHSTVLLYNKQPFASGTFVKCGYRFGILTAYHAIEPFNFIPNVTDQLGISTAKYEHTLLIEMQYLNPIKFPYTEKYGDPDMVFLEILDQSKLSWIKEFRSFWEVSSEDVVSMITECCSNSDSLWAISGLPQSLKEEKQSEGGFDRVIGLPLQVYFGGIERRFEANGFDYIEMMANYESTDPMPDSFVGISGGGLWKIPMSIHRKDLRALMFGNPVLFGLQFCQTPIEGNSRRLRCHGCKSLNSLFKIVLKDG